MQPRGKRGEKEEKQSQEGGKGTPKHSFGSEINQNAVVGVEDRRGVRGGWVGGCVVEWKSLARGSVVSRWWW